MTDYAAVLMKLHLHLGGSLYPSCLRAHATAMIGEVGTGFPAPSMAIDLGVYKVLVTHHNAGSEMEIDRCVCMELETHHTVSTAIHIHGLVTHLVAAVCLEKFHEWLSMLH